MHTSDIVVVGAGLVGSALAWGLSRLDQKVTILDEGDQTLRASRGNFGLVWVQGKGAGLSDYARWSLRSATQWPELASALTAQTGVDVALQQKGGLSLALSEDDLQSKVKNLEWLRGEVGAPYDFEVLDNKALKELVPSIGPTIPGATYSPMDGHVNPLRLFLALHRAMHHQGVSLHSNAAVERIERKDGLFICHTAAGKFAAKKVVLAAGLANKKLAQHVDIHAPVEPNRGQVLITERLPAFLNFPTNYVRQTDEGTVQLGDSLEDVGYNDGTTTPVLQNIAQRAVRCFPILANTRVVRSWAALRIMSPDGFPIYQESSSMPGAFLVTCHSGVTLAANHALTLAPWIAGDQKPEAIQAFTANRFNAARTSPLGEEHAH